MTVEFLTVGELPSVRLHAPDGAQATVSLFGAHLISWVPAGGKERLFCSAKSAMDGTKAIRGGVPIIFPQFSTYGKGARHGFARRSDWRLTSSGLEGSSCFAEFELTSNDALPESWPHQFALVYRVELQGSELQMHLRVRNAGSSAFSFAAALHTYFLVDELSSMTLDGLLGAPFSDHVVSPPQFGMQSSRQLTCSGHMDRIYRDIQGDLTMSCGDVKLVLEQDGFVDAVVWNPGAELALEVGDLGVDDHLKFICIEAAHLDDYELVPGKEWLGVHKLSCVD
jgi:glucose-6-phosphate 1-epimerase